MSSTTGVSEGVPNTAPAPSSSSSSSSSSSGQEGYTCAPLQSRFAYHEGNTFQLQEPDYSYKGLLYDPSKVDRKQLITARVFSLLACLLLFIAACVDVWTKGNWLSYSMKFGLFKMRGSSMDPDYDGTRYSDRLIAAGVLTLFCFLMSIFWSIAFNVLLLFPKVIEMKLYHSPQRLALLRKWAPFIGVANVGFYMLVWVFYMSVGYAEIQRIADHNYECQDPDDHGCYTEPGASLIMAIVAHLLLVVATVLTFTMRRNHLLSTHTLYAKTVFSSTCAGLRPTPKQYMLATVVGTAISTLLLIIAVSKDAWAYVEIEGHCTFGLTSNECGSYNEEAYSLDIAEKLGKVILAFLIITLILQFVLMTTMVFLYVRDHSLMRGLLLSVSRYLAISIFILGSFGWVVYAARVLHDLQLYVSDNICDGRMCVILASSFYLSVASSIVFLFPATTALILHRKTVSRCKEGKSLLCVRTPPYGSAALFAIVALVLLLIGLVSDAWVWVNFWQSSNRDMGLFRADIHRMECGGGDILEFKMTDKILTANSFVFIFTLVSIVCDLAMAALFIVLIAFPQCLSASRTQLVKRWVPYLSLLCMILTFLAWLIFLTVSYPKITSGLDPLICEDDSYELAYSFMLVASACAFQVLLAIAVWVEHVYGSSNEVEESERNDVDDPELEDQHVLINGYRSIPRYT